MALLELFHFCATSVTNEIFETGRVSLTVHRAPYFSKTRVLLLYYLPAGLIMLACCAACHFT